MYEYRDGEPTLISAGTLLENIAIAAPVFGKDLAWRYLDRQDARHRVELRFTDQPPRAGSALFDQIERRSVDRRPYKMRPLSGEDRQALADAAGPDIAVDWHESLRERLKIAGLSQMATDIRLRIPETFSIHNRIVDWDQDQSPHAIPARALGLDAMTLKIMRWSLARKSRTEFVNRLGSPFFAGLQMDLMPGVFSAAYCGFRVPERAPEAPGAAQQLLQVGQAVQRFWLTATRLGLVMQPCLAILAFSNYGASDIPFTVSGKERQSAAVLARKTRTFFPESDRMLFLARVGYPQNHQASRSTRRPLNELMVNA